MVKFVILILLLFPLSAFGQINFKNPPWKLGCDTIPSQQPMNICSGKAYKIADSVLTSIYNQLIQRLNDTYKSRQKTTQNISSEENKYLLTLIKSITASQSEFYTYRKSVIKIPEEEYSGGTIQPFMINNYALKITVNQIKTMIMFKNDMSGIIGNR